MTISAARTTTPNTRRGRPKNRISRALTDARTTHTGHARALPQLIPQQRKAESLAGGTRKLPAGIFSDYLPQALLVIALAVFWAGNYHDVLSGGSRGTSLTWFTLGGLFVVIVLTLQTRALGSLPASQLRPTQVLIGVHCVNITANVAIVPLDVMRNGWTMSILDYTCVGIIAVAMLPLLLWKGARFFATPAGRAVLAISLRAGPQLVLATSFVLAGDNRLSVATILGVATIAVLRTAPVIRQWWAARQAGTVTRSTTALLVAELGNAVSLFPLIAVWGTQL